MNQPQPRIGRIVGTDVLAILFILLILSLHPPALAVQETEPPADPRKLEFFENRIRPVLIDRCYECHSDDADDIGGNLLLDSRTAMLAGGDLGPALVPGKPEESLLIRALHHEDLEMPPSGKLKPEQIRDFEQWIREGAHDPRTGSAAPVRAEIDLEAGRRFWSFQPLHATARERARQPVASAKEPSSSIDSLVHQRLAAAELDFSPAAAPLDLLERVHFDLTGLPPAPELQTAFVAGGVSFEQVVDDLLDSPRFGERFGRRWLDVARYADSSGGGRVLMFPDAWRYRDYVVASFNRDKPFDQFVREQIAGDLLESTSVEQQRERITATGFLMLGAHNYELQDKELLRMEVVDEQINTVGRAFLGLTLSCARCHDHKFDPIPTRDYYALAGIFRSTKSLLPGNVSRFVTTPLPLEPEQQGQLDEYEQNKKSLEKQVADLQNRIRGLKSFDPSDLGSFSGMILDEADAVRTGNWSLSQSIRPFIGAGYHYSSSPEATVRYRFQVKEPGKYRVRAAYTASSNRSPRAEYIVSSGSLKKSIPVDQRQQPPLDSHFVKLVEVDLEANAELEVLLKPGKNGTTIADAVHLQPITPQSGEKDPADLERERQQRELESRLADAQKKLESFQQPPFPTITAMSVQEIDKPADFFVCVRGDVHKLGDPVPRGGLQVLGNQEVFENLSGSGRRELADWIANPDQPLTARVYANRIWYWVMGQGIVETPDNFGATGQAPGHPELLDYLAARLIELDWSTKKLVREIVLSRTYRQQTTSTAPAADPGNRLFSFHPRKRLDAESIRDRILYFAGVLEDTVGGPAIKPGTRQEFGYDYDSHQRSLYLPVFRNTLNGLFEVFDFPNPNLVSGKRNVSVLPTQALYMMNSEFVTEKAAEAAQRIVQAGRVSFDEQLEYAYRLALARPPQPAERIVARKYFEQEAESPNAPVTAPEKWQGFCQLLISSLDFCYLK